MPATDRAGGACRKQRCGFPGPWLGEGASLRHRCQRAGRAKPAVLSRGRFGPGSTLNPEAPDAGEARRPGPQRKREAMSPPFPSRRGRGAPLHDCRLTLTTSFSLHLRLSQASFTVFSQTLFRESLQPFQQIRPYPLRPGPGPARPRGSWRPSRARPDPCVPFVTRPAGEWRCCLQAPRSPHLLKQAASLFFFFSITADTQYHFILVSGIHNLRSDPSFNLVPTWHSAEL